MASFPGQPGKVDIRKVKRIWILMNQELMGWHWQWYQLDHMQITAPHSRQITTPAPDLHGGYSS